MRKSNVMSTGNRFDTDLKNNQSKMDNNKTYSRPNGYLIILVNKLKISLKDISLQRMKRDLIVWREVLNLYTHFQDRISLYLHETWDIKLSMLLLPFIVAYRM